MAVSICIQVDFHSVSESLASHVLGVAVAFCAQYSLRLSEPVQSSFLMRCLAAEAHYVSLFHPTSLLRREVRIIT